MEAFECRRRERYYALMREPAPGDLIIHFNDGEIVGWSRGASTRKADSRADGRMQAD